MSVRNRWFLLAASLMSLVLISATACGGGTSSTDKTATAGAGGGAKTSTSGSPTSSTGGGDKPPSDAAPDSQQKLTLNDESEPNTTDPQGLSYNYELAVTHQLFITLFDQDPKTSLLTPYAALEVPTTGNGGIAGDGVTYTVKLKPNLKWSDGSPLTAKDFVYGIIRGYNLNVSGGGYGGFITSIKGAEAALARDPKSATYLQDVASDLKDGIVAVDDHTLKLVSAQSSASFLSNFVLAVTSAVPQANVEALGDKYGTSSSVTQMLTSGAYKMSEWTPKDHLTIVPNDNFTADHKPYLKQITFRFIADRNQSYNAYQADQLDESNIPAASYPGIKADSTLNKQLYSEEEFGTRWIQVDVTIAPWNNKDFVIGINQATDRETISNDVYFGLSKASTAHCPDAVVGCEPSLFSNLDYNLDKAKASIAKAYPNGNIPTVTLETVDDPTTKALATTLQSQWQKVGVTASIITTDQKTLRADMKEHRAGTQITGWGMDYADPTDIWAIFTTNYIGGTNLGFYSRPQYDDLEAKQDATLDPTARKAILKELQQFLAADPPVIEYSIRLRANMYKPYVKGLVESPFDYILYGDQRLIDVYVTKH